MLSARLTRDGTTVAWTDIGHQVPGLHGIGPFTFDAAQYDSVLRPLLLQENQVAEQAWC